MICEGYRLNGYNATYENAYFDVRLGSNSEKNRVLEVTDMDSGITFIFEADEVLGLKRIPTKTRVWRPEK